MALLAGILPTRIPLATRMITGHSSQRSTYQPILYFMRMCISDCQRTDCPVLQLSSPSAFPPSLTMRRPRFIGSRPTYRLQEAGTHPQAHRERTRRRQHDSQASQLGHLVHHDRLRLLGPAASRPVHVAGRIARVSSRASQDATMQAQGPGPAPRRRTVRPRPGSPATTLCLTIAPPRAFW
jgi:hypothetical protein